MNSEKLKNYWKLLKNTICYDLYEVVAVLREIILIF